MSCENPNVDSAGIMPRRRKYDKSKTCVKCKQKSGNLVIRHAVYCKQCFVPLVTFRFRRALEPHINVKPDGPRRTALKPVGNLLIAFSGGLGSRVLLDLVNRCYVNPDDSLLAINGMDGGRDHPRHERVWKKVTACYVEMCDVMPEMKDQTDDIREVVAQYPGIDFLPLRLQDAFDPSLWEEAGVSSLRLNAYVDANESSLPLSFVQTKNDEDDSIRELRQYLASLPTPSALPSTLKTLVRVLLQHAALLTGSSHLLYGTSLTSLAVSLISGVAHGGGFHVREETQEEWSPPVTTEIAVSTNSKDRHRRSVRLIRPLRDVGRKECAAWLWWMGLRVVEQDEVRWPGAKLGISRLTKDFILGLDTDFPSTVSTIVRTCAKLVPKGETVGSCAFCYRPLQSGVQDWKDRIAIRSRSNQTEPPPPPGASSLSPYLCYVCHTNLTSKGARPAPPLYAHTTSPAAVPSPFWTNQYLDEMIPSNVPPASEEDIITMRRMSENDMRRTVEGFLLDD